MDLSALPVCRSSISDRANQRKNDSVLKAEIERKSSALPTSDKRQKTSEQSVIVTALGLKCTLLLLTAYLGSEYRPLRSVREFRH